MSDTQNSDVAINISAAREENENNSNSVSQTQSTIQPNATSTDIEEPRRAANEQDDESEKDEVEDEVVPVYVPLKSPSPIPMPNFTEFSISLPEVESEDDELEPEPQARALAAPPDIIHMSDLLKPMDIVDSSPSLQGIEIVHLGKEAGLLGNMQATYLSLPPGTRTNRPLALRYGDSIVYCISGQGLLWQNGWTYPFNATDCVGWKAGTGIAHTIINDSNKDGGAGENLVLLMAYEVKEEEVCYPLDTDIDENSPILEGKKLWNAPPLQGQLGPHPGVPSFSPERGNKSISEPQTTYRPSNVVNAIAELDTIGDGELFANATSLSQETGLSGRFGCNFEVPPPGTRSSDPHAHSLEDELVYIVSGSGLVWLNGHVQPVREGDAVGFPGGTGIAHCFINDSNASGEEGEPLILWIIGQNRRLEGDLVHYPLHLEKKHNRPWTDYPKYELGLHNGRPQRPRVA